MAEKLIERLRVRVGIATSIGDALHFEEAANALEAQQARIREIKKLSGDNPTLFIVLADIRQQSGVGVKPMLSELADAIGSRIRELEEALKPFSDEARKQVHSADEDLFEDWDGNRCAFTVGDLRRAAKLLEGK